MKKWNDVYFYSYNSDGTLVKNKVINIVEGTELDHNLTIYPVEGKNYIAETRRVGDSSVIENSTIIHSHYSEWEMRINIGCFYVHDSYDEAYINLVKERTGAHELGHVLGLRDVDSNNLCNANTVTQHHHELLMGYGSPLVDRSVNITYKDIAGVAITRGFHTDNDHKWLNCGIQSNGKYKLLCSICNGVKYLDDIDAYTYDTYNACSSNHTISSGNMMAVASFENQDYYKCKYCRYVAPFSNIVAQNYSKSTFSSDFHKCINNVEGLEYTFYEEHTCDTYVYLNNLSHRKSCACGVGATVESHYIFVGDIDSGSSYAPCMGCGYLVDLRDDYYNSIMSIITQVSTNGSYILSNGIVVLVDEDVQAYLDGILKFYRPDNVPATQ